jgi:hypothetical protein
MSDIHRSAMPTSPRPTLISTRAGTRGISAPVIGPNKKAMIVTGR